MKRMLTLTLPLLVTTLAGDVLAQDTKRHRANPTAGGGMYVACDNGYLAFGLDCGTPCSRRTLFCKKYPGVTGTEKKWWPEISKDERTPYKVPSFVTGINESDQSLSFQYPILNQVGSPPNCQNKTGEQCTGEYFLSGVVCDDGDCGHPVLICCHPGLLPRVEPEESEEVQYETFAD